MTRTEPVLGPECGRCGYPLDEDGFCSSCGLTGRAVEGDGNSSAPSPAAAPPARPVSPHTEWGEADE